HSTGFSGSGQSGGGLLPNAPTVKRRQIVAGNVPPATRIPWTDVIGIFAFGYPTQTTVDAFVVMPANQASPKSSVVPVLPPAGKPGLAPVPVPAWTFILRMRATWYATPSEKTR